MSRNLGRTDCDVCGGDVLHEEGERLITPEETGPYWKEYEGMLVANAHCRDCEAKYLAWVRGPKTWGFGHGHLSSENYQPNGHIDLSYRAAFNDEPADADLPVYEIRRCRVAKDGAITMLDPR
jgi:hypothetical protein